MRSLAANLMITILPLQRMELMRPAKSPSAFQADFYVLDEAFDTARVIVSSNEGVRDVLDFSSFRGNDLESDLRSRDFTINALAFDIRNETILDPLNGSSDIRSKIIRACSETSFKDDPIRILRAVRQAAAFGFKIDPVTRKAMKQAAGSTSYGIHRTETG